MGDYRPLIREAGRIRELPLGSSLALEVPRFEFEAFCDFAGNHYNSVAAAGSDFSVNKSGNGGIVSGAAVTGHPGIAILRSGTGATNSIWFGTDADAINWTGPTVHRFVCIGGIDALSDATNTFVAQFGMSAGYSAAGRAACFRYDKDINGGRYYAFTRQSSDNIIDTGVTAVAGEFHVFIVEYNTVTGEVTFSMPGSAWSYTTSTQVPTTNAFTAGAGYFRSAGTANAIAFVRLDLLWFRAALASPRW